MTDKKMTDKITEVLRALFPTLPWEFPIPIPHGLFEILKKEEKEEEKIIVKEPEPSPPPDILPPTPTPMPEPTKPEPPPEPAKLWPYMVDISDDIWHAKHPCEYIIPNNKVLQYYAKHTYLDDKGFLRYDNGYLFRNNIFVSDDKWPNRDYWYNPDYYLTHGNTGDCEDFVIAFVSILIAKGIPAIVIAGYWKDNRNSPRIRHFAAEYVYKGVVLFNDLNTSYTAPTRDHIYKERRSFAPTWMFDNVITWRRYESDWYRLHKVTPALAKKSVESTLNIPKRY